VSRLFVAVWPPEEVAEELRALPRKDRRGVRFVPPENWHVTLRFVGDADIDVVSEALDTAILPAATARLGAGVDLLFDRLLAVPVTGVEELATVVDRATNGLGSEPPGRRFVGHLTVARCTRGATMPPALGALVQAEWDVTEISLVQSRLRPTGAEYETLTTWAVPTGS
jgi:2'-5' RNA ligase